MSLPMHLRAGFKIPPLRLSGQSEPVYLKVGRGKPKVKKSAEQVKLIESPVAQRTIAIDLRLPAVTVSPLSLQSPSLFSPDCSRYRKILVVGKVLTGVGLMATPMTFGSLSGFRDEKSNAITSGQYVALYLGGLSLATLATGAALLGVANRNRKCLKED